MAIYNIQRKLELNSLLFHFFHKTFMFYAFAPITKYIATHIFIACVDFFENHSMDEEFYPSNDDHDADIAQVRMVYISCELMTYYSFNISYV
jgi:hypothetical protein